MERCLSNAKSEKGKKVFDCSQIVVRIETNLKQNADPCPQRRAEALPSSVRGRNNQPFHLSGITGQTYRDQFTCWIVSIIFYDVSTNPQIGTTTTSIQTSLRYLQVNTNGFCTSADASSGLLDFRTPRGLRLNTASFATDQFTASATLSALPILEGSIAYTFTSKPLRGIQGTALSPLVDLVQAFREIKLPRAPEDAKDWEIWQAGRRVDFRGRLR